MSTNLLARLRDAGCIHDISDPVELEKILEQERLSFYCGFDPTSDSLHVGHMLPLIMMRRIQEAGHTPIALVGSATAMIGDPSGKSEERKLLTREFIANNTSAIEKQIGLFLSPDGSNGFKLLRNDTWLSQLNYLDFLRDIGKHFSVNQMIAKDSVRSRLEGREQGISYTEFSYMLLQAYDFYWLNSNYNCRLQVGGSDQWGNITAGMELIRRKNSGSDKAVFGMTFPLLTTAAGSKFGKTEKGAVWLDRQKTSPYDFYQFWLNTADADVMNCIRLFTEARDGELVELEQAHLSNPEARTAQSFLADALTSLVHGRDDTERAKKASSVLFGGSLDGIDKDTLLGIFSDVPSTMINREDLGEEMTLDELMVRATVAPTKAAVRRLIEGGGLYLNNVRATDSKAKISRSSLIDGEVLLVRSGKKKYFIVRAQ